MSRCLVGLHQGQFVVQALWEGSVLIDLQPMR